MDGLARHHLTGSESTTPEAPGALTSFHSDVILARLRNERQRRLAAATQRAHLGLLVATAMLAATALDAVQGVPRWMVAVIAVVVVGGWLVVGARRLLLREPS